MIGEIVSNESLISILNRLSEIASKFESMLIMNFMLTLSHPYGCRCAQRRVNKLNISSDVPVRNSIRSKLFIVLFEFFT